MAGAGHSAAKGHARRRRLLTRPRATFSLRSPMSGSVARALQAARGACALLRPRPQLSRLASAELLPHEANGGLVAQLADNVLIGEHASERLGLRQRVVLLPLDADGVLPFLLRAGCVVVGLVEDRSQCAPVS